MKKFIFLCFLLLCSCAPDVNQTATNIDITTGYPSPTQQEMTITDLGYPSSSSNPISVPTIGVIPNPSSSEFANLTGYLKISPSNPEPEVGALLYLVPIIHNESGEPLLAGFSRTTDIKTMTDPNGRFYFADVPIDKVYTIILDRVSTAYLLKDPKTNEDILIVLEPNTVYDLGELIYQELP
ncbi:MAG: hypothetical protein CVU39_04115 [Chloroflexi bacterium HGW-Chloroflexi-10]|nr:MAG: hypothetical protein CVU39_04115 [Chloroflexi bacterium HGW-Chloroflexi-10]